MSPLGVRDRLGLHRAAVNPIGAGKNIEVAAIEVGEARGLCHGRLERRVLERDLAVLDMAGLDPTRRRAAAEYEISAADFFVVSLGDGSHCTLP